MLKKNGILGHRDSNKLTRDESIAIVIDEHGDEAESELFGALMGLSPATSNGKALPAMCRTCNSKIEGDILIGGGKMYHMDHLRCMRCQKDLSICMFHELEGQNLCQHCFFTSEINVGLNDMLKYVG